MTGVQTCALPISLVPSSDLVADATQQGYAPNTTSNQAITSGTLNPPQYAVLAQPDNTALIQPVQTGFADGTNTEIRSGLTAGERIITMGQSTLKTGDKISIQNDSSHQKHNEASDNTAQQAAG